jgi:sugar fermentation stimulation protein A
MRVPDKAVEGIFLKRINRFRAEVRAGRRKLAVHVPHSGRLGELLFPGNSVLVLPAENPDRKTAHDLLLAKRPGGRGWVCVDARVPNKLVREALEEGTLPGFEWYSEIQTEYRIPGGRLDFCLRGVELPSCRVETKSVTLVEGDTAVFPDAPTSRGAKHLRHLMEHVRTGGRAAILFIVLRSDAKCFSPNEKNDPVFAKILREAVSSGVAAIAVNCRVNKKKIELLNEIPTKLEK